MPVFPWLPEDAGVAKMWEVSDPEARQDLSIISRSFTRNEEPRAEDAKRMDYGA